MNFEARLSGIFGAIASAVIYLAIGALAHHLLVAPYFDPYRMMSWGVLLGWPIIFAFVFMMMMGFIGGAIMFIFGLFEKEGLVAGIGVVLFAAAWFGWKMFF
jgi:hypothetical protein